MREDFSRILSARRVRSLGSPAGAVTTYSVPTEEKRGRKPRLLGRYRRCRADSFDLGDQVFAPIGTRRILQALTESPHLALSLLPFPKITFRLSTHVSIFLLMIETSPHTADRCRDGPAFGCDCTTVHPSRTKKNPGRGKYPWQDSNLRHMV